jgi:branched-chain amino acid transport system substrate-binding protein
MKKRQAFGSWLVLAAAAICVATLLVPGAVEARNIKVGIIDTYSGPPAVFGNDALNGFKMAIDEINKQGVLGG